MSPIRRVPLLGLLVFTLLLFAAPAFTEEEPTPPREPNDQTAPEPAASQSTGPTVALIRGTRVNLRVGPRRDVLPVRTLEEGTVLLIVERVPGWVGVQVPEGFPASVSARYVERMGADAVRVDATDLNLRVAAPEPGQSMPGAFRDRLARGAVLPLIGDPQPADPDRVPATDGSSETGAGETWLRVLAPESIRAYVSDRFVNELGPLSDHEAVVAAACARRTERVRKLAAERREAEARASGLRLREAIGAAQQGLYRLRVAGGHGRTPVTREINKLEKAIRADREAPVEVRKLALAIRADMETELELRVARKDAEVARLRGLEPAPAQMPAARIDKLVVKGRVTWEAAPTWRNGGAYVLWDGEEPTHVLQLTTGLPHPLPDLKGSVGKAACTVEGSQPGDKVFGLPVIEVRKIR